MKKALIILVHGLIGWALCGATMGIGPLLTSMQTTLIIHAIAAPVFFFIISYAYHKYFGYTKPIYTAIIFLSVVVVLDFGLVAPVFVKSYEMFSNPLGTWIPFALIFLASYLGGRLTTTRAEPARIRLRGNLPMRIVVMILIIIALLIIIGFVVANLIEMFNDVDKSIKK
jgi:hypothetical protein